MTESTTQFLGDYQEYSVGNNEYLTLVFSPFSISIKERWRNNSLSAGFLADYFSNFSIVPSEDGKEGMNNSEINSAIKYIANELLENAVKFHYGTIHKITMTLNLEKDELIFLTSNGFNPASMSHFQALAERLLNEDIEDLYFEKLEKNATEEGHGGAGLGLITMVHDYQARLGWKFEQIASNFLLTTQVRVPLRPQ